jgi:predicted nucleic acid-binding protein
VSLTDDSIESNLARIARYRLAAYDAIYVELALQSGCPLLTFDRAMIASARRAGIMVVTESQLCI